MEKLPTTQPCPYSRRPFDPNRPAVPETPAISKRSPKPIEEVQDRLRDLLRALESGGDTGLADQLRTHLHDFEHVTEVRRAVTGLSMHLRAFREEGASQSSSPAIVIAANRLEDACKNALRGGVIAAASPSIVNQLQRKLILVLWAVVGGLALLAIPTAFVASGKSVEDFQPLPPQGPFEVPQGQTVVIPVKAPVSASLPEAATGMSLELAQSCATPLDEQGLTCSQLPEHWQLLSGRTTYELRHADQAFGLIVAFGDSSVQEGLGSQSLHLRARGDTPVGSYMLHFQPAYLGYGPDPNCSVWIQRLGFCGQEAGEGREDSLLPTVKIAVEIVAAQHTQVVSAGVAARRLIHAAGAESSSTAQLLMADVEAKTTDVRASLRKARRRLKKRDYEAAAEYMDTVRQGMQALEALAAEHPAEALLDDGFERLRSDWDKQARRLAKFEERLFDAWYARAHRDLANPIPDEQTFPSVARKFRTSAAFVSRVVGQRDEALTSRLDARRAQQAQAGREHREKLESRCGPLPAASWQAISGYLNAQYQDPKVSVEVANCLTPRLHDRDCWLVECDYRRRTRRLDGSKHVAKMRATFALKRNQVVRILAN